MPSFDVVSEVDMHELQNALDQTNREVGTRFDFRDTGAHVSSEGHVLTLHAPSEFQIQQMAAMLHAKLAKRGIDIGALDAGPVEAKGREARQTITVRHGIDTEISRKIVKKIKEMKIKVQASIQAEQVRVTGKKRDDLQKVMAALREADSGLPLQFVNFRD